MSLEETSAAVTNAPQISPATANKITNNLNTGITTLVSNKGKVAVIITIIIALIVTIGYMLLCYFTNKYSQHTHSQSSSSNLIGTGTITGSGNTSLFDKFSSFRHRPTITVIVPGALNGADYAAVDKQQHIFVYRHGESLPGVLTELNPQSTPLVLLVINTGAVGAVPYGFLVPAANGVPVSALDGSSLNNVSCNYSYACGSLSLQGVFTNEQLRIIGSYSGALPTYNNGNTLNPNTTQTHRTTSHWH
jgi:hypothetical protein